MPRQTYFNTADLSAFDAATAALEDPRPHPTEPALAQLGQALMTELLDTLLDTALEDHAVLICEGVIGGFHSAAHRLERNAGRAREELARLLEAFDGSEVADTAMQEVKARCDGLDVAVRAVEIVRDACAATYSTATGELWAPWRGSVASGVTAAQIDAREALRAAEARRQGRADAGDSVVVFRAAPGSDAPEDASRIFDALNWARGEWPDMALALTGARGGERIARRWAQQKGVRTVIARADFERFGRAAPFRANDTLLALRPVCALVLPATLAKSDATASPFGPAMNLAESARRQGVRCLRLDARRAAPVSG